MMRLRVCFVSPEVFHWGVYGGFGYLTWTLAKKLSERGLDVVVTQRRKGQGEVENVDGFKIYGYPPHKAGLTSLLSRLASLKYYKKAEADIYHSQAISYNTYAAYAACPKGKHVLTFQDPYDWSEWNRIAQVEPRYGTPQYKLKIGAEMRFLSRTCRKMDALYSQAQFLIPKAVKLYNLTRKPKYLPNPVPVPKTLAEKSEKPTVCFLARWDPQKRVELFFNLAQRHPEVNFIAMGKSHDPLRDEKLRRTYSKVPNLRLTGFVSEEEKRDILGRSWALVNTSIREALPISFLEALANGAALISGEDPDGLVSRFGFCVIDDDFDAGIDWLLQSDMWRRRGRAGRRHVEKVYEVERVVTRHIHEYELLMETPR